MNAVDYCRAVFYMKRLLSTRHDICLKEFSVNRFSFGPGEQTTSQYETLKHTMHTNETTETLANGNGNSNKNKMYFCWLCRLRLGIYCVASRSRWSLWSLLLSSKSIFFILYFDSLLCRVVVCRLFCLFHTHVLTQIRRSFISLKHSI